jgi:hypothetical protein
MSVFDMDGMQPALDGMVPTPAIEVGIENEINDTQGAQNRRGLGHALTVFTIWN